MTDQTQNHTSDRQFRTLLAPAAWKTRSHNAIMASTIRLKRKHDRGDYGKALYRVTLFRPFGVYPRGTFCTPTGVFHADEEIVFATTYGPTWSANNESLPYSEVDWLLPETVRLLGSLILTEQFPEGMPCAFYPLSHGFFILDERQVDLTDPATAFAVKKALLKTVGNRLWSKWVQERWQACLGQEFVLFDPAERLSIDMLPRYWERILPDNHVLMRGIQALIKSDMLARYEEFQEEGAIATFIALDASFQLVLRHLRANGISNPSAKDAGDWLYMTFDEPMGACGAEGMKYFESFYDQRVQTVHPASRFGDVPYAPVMVDDRIHLRQALPQVFAYVLLGEHTPFFWKQVAEREEQGLRPVPPCAGMTDEG